MSRSAFPESLREIDAFAFSYDTLLTEIVIPDNVIRIGSAAFANCRSVQKITLGKSLKSLASLAFEYICAEEIVMPDSLTDLGYGCFSMNTALKSATVGKRCTGLPYGTFFGCSSLESVSFTTWCTIMDSAFGNCTAMRRVYFALSKEIWEERCSVGTESDENPVNGYGNTYFREADVFFYSEEPIYDGEHWGYDENGNKTVWEQPAEADPHLIFEKNESGTAYTVTGLEKGCTDAKIVIPATHDGLPVTKIGRSAFWEKGKTRSMTVTILRKSYCLPRSPKSSTGHSATATDSRRSTSPSGSGRSATLPSMRPGLKGRNCPSLSARSAATCSPAARI